MKKVSIETVHSTKHARTTIIDKIMNRQELLLLTKS
jgi:hypothetical protein